MTKFNADFASALQRPFRDYTPNHEVVYAAVEFTIAEAGPGYASFLALLADDGFQFTETGLRKIFDGLLHTGSGPILYRNPANGSLFYGFTVLNISSDDYAESYKFFCIIQNFYI